MKNNEKQKRYAVGYYNHEERVDNSSNWNKYAENRLVNYIYDNKSEFNMRYKSFDKDKNEMLFIISPEELNKAKEHFVNDKEVLEFIDLCNDYDRWKTSCNCCDSISINTISYTYREYGGCVGRVFNCTFCSGLKNRAAYRISEQYKNKGVDSAIDLLIDVIEGRYIDKEEKYFCKGCDYDLRFTGFVHNGKHLMCKDGKGKWIETTVDDYNKLEDRYFEVQQTDEVNGYRCSICNTEIEEDMVNEIVRLNSFVD